VRAGNEFCERLAYYGCEQPLALEDATRSMHCLLFIACARRQCVATERGVGFSCATEYVNPLGISGWWECMAPRGWARHMSCSGAEPAPRAPRARRLSTNLIIYMTRVMHYSPAFASAQLTLFEGTAYLTPILGAWLADAAWGRFKTILVFSIIYMVVRPPCPPCVAPLAVTEHVFDVLNVCAAGGDTCIKVATCTGLHASCMLHLMRSGQEWPTQGRARAGPGGAGAGRVAAGLDARRRRARKVVPERRAVRGAVHCGARHRRH